MNTLEGASQSMSLQVLTETFETFMTWITTMIGTIASNPLLLIGVAAFVAAIIIRLAYKALHGRG